MVSPQFALNYLKENFRNVKSLNQSIDDQILKSAIIYKLLYFNEFNKLITINEILDLYDGEIGLIGPGNGCFTYILERLFGKIKCCHLHSAFHDAYGRFFMKYQRGRGYCYVIPENMTTHCLKNSPLLGHISGFIWSIIYSSEY